MKPQPQFFLKVDLEFTTQRVVSVWTHRSFTWAGVEGQVETYKLHMEAKAEDEGACIDAVFEYAESLRDALTQFIDERDQKHLER